jgi:hypothetical protein
MKITMPRGGRKKKEPFLFAFPFFLEDDYKGICPLKSFKRRGKKVGLGIFY